MKRRLVLFDVDGTLLLSRGAGRRAIVVAMKEWLDSTDLTRVGEVRFDGKTDPQIVSELLRAAGVADPDHPARIDQVLTRYLLQLEIELARPDHVTQVLPGIPDLLSRIEATADGILGLLTGNVATGARLKLRSAALDPDRFRLGAYGSDHADRGALPPIAARRARAHFGREPRGNEVVIIGDTPADMTCGRGIGARAIGVATGAYSTAELTAAGAAAAFSDLSDTTAVMAAIWN